jgi:formylglycine-generating enzyme required for sulfatase activity
MHDETPIRQPVQVVLIPGGEFLMGDDSMGDHSPAHRVVLDPFYIDAHEVTNARYHAFCQATGHRLPEFWERSGFRCGPEFPDHPVVGVNWRDAVAYATWCGGRLPTEAEWEYAARGGLSGMDWPNGDSLDPSYANFKTSELGGPVAVRSYPANGFGLFEMAGNVVEWVSDYYSADYYAWSAPFNPQGPETGRFRVIRGGGWHSGSACCRVYFRNALPENWVDIAVGFRCARDIER